MLKKCKDPFFYNFDFEKEYNKYKKYCNKEDINNVYAAWKKDIVQQLNKMNEERLENFKHFLINEKRDEENKLVIIDGIWIPINVLYISTFVTFFFGFINIVTNYIDKMESIYKEYVDKAIEIIGQGSIEKNIKVLQKEFLVDLLKLLEKNFYLCIGFIVIFILIAIILVVLFYKLSKNRRKKVFTKINFYEDIVSVIKGLQNEKKKQNKMEDD